MEGHSRLKQLGDHHGGANSKTVSVNTHCVGIGSGGLEPVSGLPIRPLHSAGYLQRNKSLRLGDQTRFGRFFFPLGFSSSNQVYKNLALTLAL